MTDDEKGRTVAFRCPPALLSAIAAAAQRDLVTMSDVARQAVLRDLRQRGFMPADHDQSEPAV